MTGFLAAEARPHPRPYWREDPSWPIAPPAASMHEEEAVEAAAGFDARLFMPLAPVLDAAPDWRPDGSGIPATALPALGGIVRDALGGQEWAVSTRAVPWETAAAIIDAAERPDGWAETGLPARTFAPIAAGAAGVLAAAAGIEELAACGAAGPLMPHPEPGDVLEQAASRGPDVWALVLQALLARMDRPEAVVRVIGSARGIAHAAPLRAAAERGIAALLDRMARRGGSAGPLADLGLREAGMELQRAVRLLECTAGHGAGPERRRHADTLRQRLAASAEERFRTGLAQSLVAPLRALAPPVGWETVAALEEAARDLRRLETGARSVGGSAPLGALLRAAAAMVAEMDAESPLAPVERARLIEILAGPEAALTLLAGAGHAWAAATRTA
ncbi:MAG: hypothetical protein JSR21_07940 [Proteobacteria bacterium]|nr:hypothetical protein [Pseudomonadota bacterium]